MVENKVVPTLIAVAETQITRVANRAMIDAINDNISTLLDGKELLHFETGSSGDLLYVRTNAAELNRIQAESLAVLENVLQQLDGFTVSVPLGQALGSKVLAAYGPKIKIRLYPYGSVTAQVTDSFDVTGINQTRYNLCLTVTCMVRVVIPLIAARTEVSTDVPLATILIPGKVPDTYLTLPTP
jgi:sporulation protein YunB